ncbi:hypothetical protein [Sphingobium sp.]|uniref:hypothetical protein n=1 Tax=Sphingobium sp. TaxID=1912891 RepID=UPI0035C77401
MDHSPKFCRAQAAFHQSRADATSLPNVRVIEYAAAQAWTREAELAEMVDRRRARMGLPS